MRWAIGAALVVAMLAFGLGVYHTAGVLKAGGKVVHRPNEVSAPPLPGTMYVVQGGAIFRFQHGSFTQVTAEDGWMQPAARPGDNQLVAVRRQINSSDLFLLTTGGKQVVQLTRNSTPGPAEGNHWSFYPRFSADGATLFYDYDPKSGFNNYQVDLAIYASPSNPDSRGSLQWTHPNDYTGGDVYPVPLRGGGLIYVKYSIDDSFKVHSEPDRRAGRGDLRSHDADAWLAGHAGERPAGRLTCVLAGWKDDRVPGPVHARRSIPAVDSRLERPGFGPQHHNGPRPRLHVSARLDRRVDQRWNSRTVQ
ncbi:MAG: hypothetical protein AUI15_01960 [Actinobacteria bacterium 13_2_20CM_2_66_6]|nr:MAG: hypothetical protein AUI15_01960 [Actinobacteria bacterium 13_2_20CM_2_66_6]